MTADEATQLGYRVMKASACEVGLVKDNRGIRTWWCRDFGGKLPSLSHPEILKAIEINENLLKRILK